ncbi:MAG: hypothetical protein CMN76_10980 [Spirochaetaceae bacterium]|nr:hypothetical protein [Spirochaetaceae bacterium]
MHCCYFWIRILPASLRLAYLFSLPLALLSLPVLPGAVVAQTGPDFDIIRQKGLEAFDARQYGQASEFFQRAYELQPYNDDVRYRLALSLIYQDPQRDRRSDHPFGEGASYQKDLARAVQLLKESVTVQERVEVRSSATGLRHFHLGVAYWFSGRADLALDSFRRSFRSDFTRTDALYNRIVILRQMGKTKEAQVATSEYLRMTSIEDLDD